MKAGSPPFAALVSSGILGGAWGQKGTSIAGLVLGRDDLADLSLALDPTGLSTVLEGEGPFTLFAPNTAAFDDFMSYSPGTLEKLLADKDDTVLRDILAYHIAPEFVEVGDIIGGRKVLQMVNGDVVELSGPTNMSEFLCSGVFSVNGANIVDADAIAPNGVVHTINKILIPSAIVIPPGIYAAAVENGNFQSLTGAIQMAGLEEQLKLPGKFTVFAPTDAAFAAFAEVASEANASQDGVPLFTSGSLEDLIGQILGYHVVPNAALTTEDLSAQSEGSVQTLGGSVPISAEEDGTIFVGGVPLSQTDIIGSNGVIHAIDAVIVPDWLQLPNLSTPATAGDLTIAELVLDPDYGEVFEALAAVDLMWTLEGEGPFTLFAPTNAAFADLSKVSPGTLLQLSLEEGAPTLKEILLYHVLDKVVVSQNIRDGLNRATSLQGEEVSFSFAPSGQLQVNDAGIETADVVATNGVVHAIDTVLIPSTVTILPSFSAATAFDHLSIVFATAILLTPFLS